MNINNTFAIWQYFYMNSIFITKFVEIRTYYACHIIYKWFHDITLHNRISRTKRAYDHLSNAQCN